MTRIATDQTGGSPVAATPDGTSFERLVADIRSCTVCRAHLPLGPRPILRGRPPAPLLIISQAPGARAHATGLSFDDRSGDRLRAWLALGRVEFYDEALTAIIGMGLCYPGRDGKGGDLPPRRECAPRWHPLLRAVFGDAALTLLVGSHAIRHHLPGVADAASMTATIRRWREFPPTMMPLPHPSWRTTRWQRDNPWFEGELLPQLRIRVRQALSPPRCAPYPHR
jgi:uracil-DNA glycosylase